MFSEDNVGLVGWYIAHQFSEVRYYVYIDNIDIIIVSRGQFRAGLKTQLFNQAYIILWEHIVLREYCTYLLTYSLMIIIDIDIIIPI